MAKVTGQWIDYDPEWHQEILRIRQERLQRLITRIKREPEKKEHILNTLGTRYINQPWDFINDWGFTFEPRNPEIGRPAVLPFILWERQVEYLQWLLAKWRNQERGLTEKSRDCGITWLCVGFTVCMWRFVPGFSAGFGSRKESLVDKRGDFDSIFEKARFFVRMMPKALRPKDYHPRAHASHMRILNPNNSSSIIGEAGDQIGRGGRKSIYLVDESAFIEQQDSVDSALSQTTNCQIDVSTPNGSGNAFYKKRQRYNNTDKVFIFDWRDDPRKDDAWYQKQCEEFDEVIVAQEIDRDYTASQQDSFLPGKWLKACIDAHIKLGFDKSGIRASGFDPADIGDAKGLADRYGSVITQAQQKMSGDITDAIPWAYEQSDHARSDVFVYDGDGMGAPSMKLAFKKRVAGRMKIIAYHGSAGVLDPEKPYRGNIPEDADISDKDLKTNIDTFVNYRAQTWTWLRDRVKATFDAVSRAEKGLVVNISPDSLFSISSECVCLHEVVAELARPKRIWNDNGKILVESKKVMKKRNVDSPNIAEAVVMAMSVKEPKEKPKKKFKVREHRVRDRTIGY